MTGTTVDFKLCRPCGLVQPAANFNKRAASNDGLSSKCKSCAAAYAALDKKRNPEKYRERKRDYEAKNRDRKNAWQKRSDAKRRIANALSSFNRTKKLDIDLSEQTCSKCNKTTALMDLKPSGGHSDSQCRLCTVCKRRVDAKSLYDRNAEKLRAQRRTDHYREVQRNKRRRYRSTLHDIYIKTRIAQAVRNITTKDIPPELIEVERLHLLIKRHLKDLEP